VPESLEDTVLGRLEWDGKLDWWTGEVELTPGQRFALFVSFEEEDDGRDVVLAQASEWVARLRQFEPEYRAWSAARLVESRWNTDEPMTAADIDRLLRAASIECVEDGSALLYWDDGDKLFFGHNLYTELTPDGRCVEVRSGM
jgi:hypothetical protein